MKTHDEVLQYILQKYDIHPRISHNPVDIKETRHRGGMTKWFADLGFTAGAEIGTEQGQYSKEICKDNPNLKLFCIDPWYAYNDYKDHTGQDELDSLYDKAVKRLSGYNCQLIRKTSMEAVKDFRDGELDFVFIDGNHHFDYVMCDIIEWSKKVHSGGIVSGHDYLHDKIDAIPYHVADATHVYTFVHKISPWFLFKKDKNAGWAWVKP